MMRKILRKKRNGEYTGITSIDPSLLPEDSIPLLVFVNSRSGGQLGGYLFNQLGKEPQPAAGCRPVQDGSQSRAPAVLRLAQVRVLVCGGDGTVAWILQALEALEEIDPKPPVGILPLGTGNDLRGSSAGAAASPTTSSPSCSCRSRRRTRLCWTDGRSTSRCRTRGRRRRA